MFYQHKIAPYENTHYEGEKLLRLSALVLNFLSLGEEKEWEMTLYFSLLSTKCNSTWLGMGMNEGWRSQLPPHGYLQSDAE